MHDLSRCMTCLLAMVDVNVQVAPPSSDTYATTEPLQHSCPALTMGESAYQTQGVAKKALPVSSSAVTPPESTAKRPMGFGVPPHKVCALALNNTATDPLSSS